MKNGLIIKGADFSSHKISNTGETDWSESGTLRGQDGISPIATVSKSGNTATVSITDANGTTTTTITDGVSPTITASKVGKVTTLSITDSTGTNTVQINDGVDGQGQGSEEVHIGSSAPVGDEVVWINPSDSGSIDNTPTVGSSSLITSGGVYSALQGKANTQHTHSISDITDFPDPISVVDSLDSTSTTSALSAKQGKNLSDALSNKVNISSLATVATSGSYNDLTDKPSATSIIDSLNSTSTTAALSANQGKVLNEAISGKANTQHTHSISDITNFPETVSVVDSLESTSTTSALSANQGRVLGEAVAGKANAGDIPTVNDSTITIKQNGETKGTFTLNQSTGSTIDVGFGRETVFTAEFLKKVLTCRMNNEVWLTSLFDPAPNMVKYNGLSDPGTSSTNWCGYGVACTAGESTRIIIHNVNVDPWKGRTFTFTIAAGYEFAIASGTVTQSSSWLRTYPQTSDLPWNWHGHNDPVTITIGDMLSIMIRVSDGSVISWSSFYVTMWNLLTIEETPDSVQNPPRQLKDSRYVGYRVGVLGDSILAGASTKAYKTALDVLVSDYGIIPVPRCIAGSCIAPTSADYSRDSTRYKNRIEANWRVTTGGYNGQENGVNRESDPFLGVLIFGVNDVLMDKVALDAEPFIRTTNPETGCQELSINTSALNPEGYLAALLDLESTVKTANGTILNHFYLVGPYNCKWPGDYPMTTTGINPNGDTGEDYIRLQRQFCMLKGWSYMDLLSSQLNTFLPGISNDNLHPSQEGHQLLGDLLGQMLCGTILTQAAPIFDTVEGGGGSSSNDPEVYVGNAEPSGNEVVWVDTSSDVDVDTTPTQNSNNLITSGGVYNAIANIPAPTPEIFWATYGTTTATEIQTALTAGKAVMCKYTDRYYLCTELSSNVYNFTCTSGGGDIIRRLYVSSVDDSWSTNTASLELTNNRLASSSQTAPSDSNYYSALATKNLVDAVDFRKDTNIDLSLFGKILCIGDSWTQGVFDYRDNEDNLRGVELPQYSYPTLLASLTGRSVTNKGDAGKTSTTWYSNHSGDVLRGHDACIIFLGINDVSQGDTSQTSTSLTNIITKVKTDNPDVMKIFIVSMPNHLNNNTYAQTVNGILQSVADSEGAYYLDISGVVIPRDEAHPLAIGYEILAKAIYNKASEVMRNNRSDFEDIFTMTGSNGSSMDSDGDSILLGSAHLANQVVYSDVDLEANPKGYIDKDTKEFVGNDDFVCSGFVYIKGISKVEYKVRSNGVSVPFCFYDKDKQLIPELTIAAREDAWADSIDLTGSGYSEACYLVMSSWVPAYPPYLKLRGKYDFDSFLKTGDIEYTEGNNLFNPEKVQTGIDINTSGNIGFHTGSVLSGWINIPSGAEAIYFKGLPTYVPEGSTHRFGCWYNANKEVIGAIDLSVSSATSVEILPTSGDEVRYLRFTILGNPPTGDYDISGIIVSTEDIPFEPYHNSITSIAGYSVPTLTSLTAEDINRICV